MITNHPAIQPELLAGLQKLHAKLEDMRLALIVAENKQRALSDTIPVYVADEVGAVESAMALIRIFAPGEYLFTGGGCAWWPETEFEENTVIALQSLMYQHLDEEL